MRTFDNPSPTKPKRRRPSKDAVYRTLDDLEAAYGNAPSFHGMLALIGVQATKAGAVHWYRWSDERGGFVYTTTTVGPGPDFTDLEIYR